MDYSRNIQCDNSQGGVSRLYVMPWVQLLESQIVVSNNVLTSFPNTTVYKIDAENVNFNIDANDDFYDEKLSFQLKKLLETDNFKPFISQDFRVIVKTNNKKYRLLGLKNGMIGRYKEESGTNRNDFNGYSFDFQNKEEESAPYLTDLSFFNIVDTIILRFIDMTFETYKEMIDFGNPTSPVNARVLNDEDKNLENTNYFLYPDGIRNWVASTSDN